MIICKVILSINLFYLIVRALEVLFPFLSLAGSWDVIAETGFVWYVYVADGAIGTLLQIIEKIVFRMFS